MNSTDTSIEHLASLLDGAEQRPGGSYRSRCPDCREDGFWLTEFSFNCHSCGWEGTHGALAAFFAEEGDQGGAALLPEAIPLADASEDSAPEYVAEGLIIAGEIHVFAGDGGAGKTTLLVALAGAVAADCGVWDMFTTRKPGNVLYVSEEDSEGVLKNRLEALCLGHGWHLEVVLNRVHCICRAGARIDEARWQQHILDEVVRMGARVVILDPLFELTSGEENSPSESKGYIRFLRRLGAETGVAVVLVCHAGKAGSASDKKRLIDRIRGASSLYHAARVVYFIETDVRGFAVIPLKFNRAELPQRFVVGREIETDPDNDALWTRARLTYLTAEHAQEQGAEALILEALTKTPGLLTKELRNLAVGTGVSSAEVSKGIKSLHHRGEIRFDSGGRNKRFWHLVEPAGQAGQAGQVENLSLPSLYEPAGQVREASQQPACPVRGQAGGAGTDSDDYLQDLLSGAEG